MPALKPIELSDKQWIDPIFKSENSKSADFCFSNMFLWRNFYHPSVAKCGERILIKLNTPHGIIYSFPVGSGELEPAVNALKEDADKNGLALRIRGITESNVKLLSEAFPGRFDFSEDRSAYDYVYSAEKLSTLSGKKLHAKRNYINRFLENADWGFEALTRENIPDCIKMNEEWIELNSDDSHFGLSYELSALSDAFEYIDVLGLEGGVLRQMGRVVAFTIGEKLSSDVYAVHYEKAFYDVAGAYPMINCEFVRHVLSVHPEIEYINREDDMGSENLRKAKESYYPELMIEKFTAFEK